MTTVTCGDCQHFRPDTREPDDRPGECVAVDPETLPYAWRWCPRYRTDVRASVKSECPRFERKEIPK